MAINYLNSLDLNKNYLNNAAIQNLAAEPTADTPGQIYFNTVSQTLRITEEILPATDPKTYKWVEVGGGVETLDTTDGTYIELTPDTPSTGAVIVTADLSAVDGTATTTARFLTKDNTWAVPAFDNYSNWSLEGDSGTAETVSSGETVDIAGGLKITTDIAANRTLNIVHDLQEQTDSANTATPGYGGTFTVVDTVTRDTTGHVTGINTKTVTIPDSDNTNTAYDLTSAANATAGVDIILTGSDSSIDTVNIIGTDSEVEIAQTTTANQLQIGLPSDVIIGNTLAVTSTSTFTGVVTASAGVAITTGSLTAGANTTIDLGANRVTNIADPTSAQDAATKAYVDAATVGGLIYQGAYDPVTNTPDIDRGVVVKTTSITAMGSGGGPFTGIANTTATTGTGQGLTLNIELNSSGNVTSASVANGGTGYAVGDTVGLTGLSGHSGSVIGIATIATAGSPGADIGIETGWTYTVVADGTFYGEAVGVGDVLISETDNPTNLVHWTTVQNNIDLASATQVGIGNVAAGTGISVAYVSGTATVTNTDTNTSNTATGTITAGQLSGTVTHAFGVNTIVQTIDSSGNTVYCDVSRTTTTSVATITAAQATDITILVQKIG